MAEHHRSPEAKARRKEKARLRYHTDAEYRARANARSKATRTERLARNPGLRKLEHIKKRYGLTLEQYNAILEAQFFTCACCGNPLQLNRAYKVHVDHCHNKGHVRAILCIRCNILVGFRENSDWDKVDTYLRNFR